MAALLDKSKDLQRYILQDQQPVICNDEAIWRAFMNDGSNLLVAHDPTGKFQVITVFLGFNYVTTEQPKFFQTTCLGADSEKNLHYSATWEMVNPLRYRNHSTNKKQNYPPGERYEEIYDSAFRI
ncbi:MAG: hypothetical protein AAGE59_38290 [Cyanobacteria bacterium P01_F01_bin.86]